jgi:putative sigma-54 modulation protein
MNTSSSAATRTLIRGIHLDLTPDLKEAIETKCARLFRHQDHIIRLRVDIELDKTKDIEHRFVAKGHIEIGGPDILASVSSDDAYKSMDLLTDKLDNLLRRRASHVKDKRDHPHAVDLPSDLPKVS